MGPKRIFFDKIKNGIYDWSYNRAYIDAFYRTFLIVGMRKLAKFAIFCNRRIIDGIPKWSWSYEFLCSREDYGNTYSKSHLSDSIVEDIIFSEELAMIHA
ncbi:NADH:ubiquinone/plastoquinone oxidoreductase, chloroplast chain 5, C-terminal [Cynara cardunculus var. scolymus]|uniref:NAD(P)H-quinone oxidoreductase subunit 5, chloroplastic n=1 Tax=Cynara cardunculus var. scolymus TaxID=59895 RepID=A0A118JZ37_CYNCS|nr:NADH:ubiquinone/plastoquinone oxidoreductase, chloroplast chain 5, C-terminal [Cynara cardunculus var. scolymus]